MKYYIIKAKNSIKKNGLWLTIKLFTNRVILHPFYSLIIIISKKNQLIDLPKSDFDLITKELEDLGIGTKSYEVFMPEFDKYIEEVNYPEFYIEDIERRRKGRFRGKALEHYVTDSFFNFKKGDIYVDIAGSSSPYVDIVNTTYEGVTTYILDFVFKKGIYGNKIGADATNTGLPHEFCTKISLHCAYEMFLNEDDIKLIPEMYRILKPGGIAVIIPVYMNQQGFICRNLAEPSKEKPVLGNGEILVWRNKGNTFRNYSARTLKERVIDTAIEVGFDYELFRISNLKEITLQLDSPMFLVLSKPNNK